MEEQKKPANTGVAVVTVDNKTMKRPEPSVKKKSRVGVTVLVVGLLVLVAGFVLMLLKLPRGEGLRDAEYLTQVGTWVRADAPGVVWEFAEVGKGKLTTNDGLNEYDFLWAIEDGKLLIETDWLYTLNDEYAYRLDQDAKELVLDNTMTFRPAVQE